MNKPAEQFRLKSYYYVVEITGLIPPLIFGLIIYAFRDQITWLREPTLNLYLFIGIFVYHSVFFILREIFKKKIFFSLARYGYLAFFVAVLYTVGGVESSFAFILIFPLIVSATDLDAKSTRTVGIVITLAYALLIFADPTYYRDFGLVVGHILRVILLGIISFHFYRIVKEILRQKYEKEEASRKFVELSELNRVKNDFLTVAEHQLRTPLTAAKWALGNLLEEKNLSENNKMPLREISGKIVQSLAIVNEMLQTAETGAGGLKLERQKTDLGILITGLISELQFLIRKNSTQVRFHELSGLVIDGDQKLLRIALANIIDNAVRYSPNETVNIDLRRVEDKIIITIKDTGIGIAPADLPYIFERFYRGKNAITLDPNESGVGLYISKKIIELHNGEVKLESSVGQGTSVSVALPVEPPPPIDTIILNKKILQHN
ncbi:MAG: HAMP domain-containing sensor histidine kinase [Patescibacteria group bacterium]